jgi:hypothetical protein
MAALLVQAGALAPARALAPAGALAAASGAPAAARASAQAGVLALLRLGGVPEPGHSSSLQSVFCLSRASCWAVGRYASKGATLNQALSWNGRAWSRVTVPSPGGTAAHDVSELFGIHCVTARDCWAVGTYEKRHAGLNEALHWNGRHWSAVPIPLPGGTQASDVSELFGVTCTSARNCWSAGEYGTITGASQRLQNQVLHWDGRRWSVAAVPVPGGTGAGHISVLAGVECVTAGDCWAVGAEGTIGSSVKVLNEALHWTGRKWSAVTVPSPAGRTPGAFNELQGLSCTSATDCWTDGTDGTVSATATFVNQAMRWNGRTWAQAATPDPDGTGTGANNQLIGVSCTAPGNCWAVGYYGAVSGGPGPVLNEALRWNGTRWSLHATHDPGGTGNGDVNHLNAVRCTSATFCWAVGDRQRVGGADINQRQRLGS